VIHNEHLRTELQFDINQLMQRFEQRQDEIDLAIRKKRHQRLLALLTLISLFLIGLGISSLTLPALVSVLGASGSAVGITTLTLGAFGIIGLVTSLAWLYRDSLKTQLKKASRLFFQATDETTPLLEQAPIPDQTLTFTAEPSTRSTENSALAINSEAHTMRSNDAFAADSTSYSL
jgi:uncharacterized membrane protein YqjE